MLRPSQVTPDLLEIRCEASRRRPGGHQQFCFTQPIPPRLRRGNHVGTCRREEGPCPLQFLQELSDFWFTPEPPPSVTRESLLHQKEALPCPQPIACYCAVCTACFAEQPAGTNFFGGCTYLYKMSSWSVVGMFKRQ